jgi:hypothetical protein
MPIHATHWDAATDIAILNCRDVRFRPLNSRAGAKDDDSDGSAPDRKQPLYLNGKKEKKIQSQDDRPKSSAVG